MLPWENLKFRSSKTAGNSHPSDTYCLYGHTPKFCNAGSRPWDMRGESRPVSTKKFKNLRRFWKYNKFLTFVKFDCTIYKPHHYPSQLQSRRSCMWLVSFLFASDTQNNSILGSKFWLVPYKTPALEWSCMLLVDSSILLIYINKYCSNITWEQPLLIFVSLCK